MRSGQYGVEEMAFVLYSEGDGKFRRFLSQGMSLWFTCRLQEPRVKPGDQLGSFCNNPGRARTVTVTAEWLYFVCILKAQATGSVKGLDGDIRKRSVKPDSKVSGKIELLSAETVTF